MSVSPPPSGTHRARLSDLVLGTVPALRPHVDRSVRLLTLTAFALTLLLIAATQALTPWSTTLLVGGYALPGALLFYAVVRRGRLRPAGVQRLAGLQLLFSISAIVLSYTAIPHARSSAVLLLCLVLAFEMDRLSTRQLMRACAFAVLLLSASLVYRLYGPEPLTLSVELHNVVMASVLLPLAMYVGAHIGRLNAIERSQNDALAQTLARLEHLSTHDMLTGLPNRLHMAELLAAEASPAGRGHGRPAVIILDIDHFKAINDRHGHAAGDAVLKAFADIAARVLTPQQVLGRWGGEEFLVVLPTCGEYTAVTIAEALRNAIAIHHWSALSPGLSVTVSAGVCAQQAGESADRVLELADRALYAAKAGGRNHVRRADRREVADLPGQEAAERAYLDGRLSAVDSLADPADAPQRAASADGPPLTDADDESLAHVERLHAGAGPRRPASVSRWHTWLLTDVPLVQMRLKLTLAASATYLAWIAALILVVQPLGLMPPGLVDTVVLIDLLAVLVFYPLMRHPITRHWSPAATAMPQILWALVATAVSYAGAPEMRPSLLQTVCIIPIFAMVAFGSRAARATAVVTVTTMLVLLGATTWLAPSTELRMLEALKLILGIYVVGRLSLLAISHGKLRDRVRDDAKRLALAVAAVQRRANRDALTGLYNRARMQQLLSQAYEASLAASTPAYAVALIDLDHFKRTNDTLGHRAGDAVLRAFARAAHAALREGDVIARWGGEEFLILLRGKEAASQALTIAQRLQQQLRHRALVPVLPSLRVTYSCGVAQPLPGESLDQLLARADRALYRAKAGGRDRCVLANAHGDRQALHSPAAGQLQEDGAWGPSWPHSGMSSGWMPAI